MTAPGNIDNCLTAFCRGRVEGLMKAKSGPPAVSHLAESQKPKAGSGYPLHGEIPEPG
jgi:hypothetical protein